MEEEEEEEEETWRITWFTEELYLRDSAAQVSSKYSEFGAGQDMYIFVCV